MFIIRLIAALFLVAFITNAIGWVGAHIGHGPVIDFFAGGIILAAWVWCAAFAFKGMRWAHVAGLLVGVGIGKHLFLRDK